MERLELQRHIASLSAEEFIAFLTELPTTPLLTIDEEMELIHHIRKGREAADIAKEMLAKSYLRFIYSVAKTFKDQGLSVQELIVSGISGLIKAVGRYDESRGFKFMSYSVWWIKQQMLNDILKQETNQ